MSGRVAARRSQRRADKRRGCSKRAACPAGGGSDPRASSPASDRAGNETSCESRDRPQNPDRIAKTAPLVTMLRVITRPACSPSARAVARFSVDPRATRTKLVLSPWTAIEDAVPVEQLRERLSSFASHAGLCYALLGSLSASVLLSSGEPAKRQTARTRADPGMTYIDAALGDHWGSRFGPPFLCASVFASMSGLMTSMMALGVRGGGRTLLPPPLASPEHHKVLTLASYTFPWFVSITDPPKNHARGSTPTPSPTRACVSS